MTLQEGATNEINSRWPEFKQRNCALSPDLYGVTYYKNMVSGIQLIRDHHDSLKNRGDTEWSIPESLLNTLNELSK